MPLVGRKLGYCPMPKGLISPATEAEPKRSGSYNKGGGAKVFPGKGDVSTPKHNPEGTRKGY
jgi:hypothetical protein